jgi:hypothetical protein
LSEQEQLQVIQPNTALAQGQFVGGSSWGDDDEPVKPRYIKIKQSKTPDADFAENGQFFDKETGEVWDEITIVAFGVRKTRRLSTPYKAGVKSETLCRSANRKVPVTTDQRFTPKAKNCDVCAYGQRAWANYKNDKVKPANPCEKEIEWVFIMASNPTQPYIFNFSRYAMDITEKIYDQIKARSKSIGATTGVRPELYEYEITYTTEPGDKPTTKEFFYPVLEVNELSAEEAKEKYGAAYEVYVNARQDAFEAAQSSAEYAEEEAEATTERVVETASEAKPVTASRTTFTAPPSRRKAGDAVKPTYVPPTIDGDTGTVVTP